MVCLWDFQVKIVEYRCLTLKSEVWARNRDFGVISVDMGDKSGGQRAIKQEGGDLGFPQSLIEPASTFTPPGGHS